MSIMGFYLDVVRALDEIEAPYYGQRGWGRMQPNCGTVSSSKPKMMSNCSRSRLTSSGVHGYVANLLHPHLG